MRQAEQATEGLEEAAYRRIREALIHGAFAPLEKLSIRALSEKLGLGPMPVRAALRRLISERGLDATASGTAFVPRLSRKDFALLTQMRLALEPLALRQAAAHLGPAEFDHLEACLSRHQEALAKGDPEAASTADREFLFTLYRAAGAEMLVGVIESLWLRRSPMFWEARWALMAAALSRAPHRHGEILAALRQGEIERAAAALVEEITLAADFLNEVMQFAD